MWETLTFTTVEGTAAHTHMFWRERHVGERLRPWLRTGNTVLDLGAGRGRISMWLRDNVGVRPTLSDVMVRRGLRVELPFILQEDPFTVPVEDNSFDHVMILFVLHHIADRHDQERLIAEPIRIAKQSILILEDTPESPFSRLSAKVLDWLFNRPFGVPTPFSFRTRADWCDTLERMGLVLRFVGSHRVLWPSLNAFPNTLFVAEVGHAWRQGGSAEVLS